MSSQIYWVELANGGWLSFDHSGRILAVKMPAVGEGSFELLKDVFAQAEENSRRWAEENDDELWYEPPGEDG